jgi:hypothetical protein
MSNTAERQTLKVDMETLQLLKAQKVRHLKEVGGKISLSKYLKSILTEKEQVTLAQVATVEVLPETPAENKESEIMAGESTCVNCQFKDRDIAKLKEEVIPALKSEAEKTVKELTGQVETLKVQLAEKPSAPMVTVDHIGEGLENFIEHCESGVCPSHSKQWADIRRRIMDVDGPKLVTNALENLPDDIVESEGLKRGFIPRRITIPMGSIKRR